jgi:hypothetical protein
MEEGLIDTNKILGCLVRLHDKLLTGLPKMSVEKRLDFQKNLLSRIQKADAAPDGAIKVMALAPLASLLSTPKELSQRASSFGTHYNQNAEYKYKVLMNQLNLSTLTIDSLKPDQVAKVADKFRLRPKTREEMKKINGFFLENDFSARLAKRVGKGWEIALETLNSYFDVLKMTYVHKFGQVDDAMLIPKRYKLIQMLNPFRAKKVLDSQGIHSSLARVYCKRINERYKHKYIRMSPIWLKNGVDYDSITAEAVITVENLQVPESFVAAIKNSSFAMCLIHFMENDFIIDKISENVQGGHTGLVVVKDKRLYICDTYLGDALATVLDALMEACGASKSNGYTGEIVGRDFQQWVELMDTDAALFHKVVMTQRLTVPTEFTYIGHKIDRDFFGYCGTFALFAAEFFIWCSRSKACANIKQFDISAQFYALMEAYNPCIVYNYARLWARCMEQNLDISTRRSGSLTGGSIDNLEDGYDKLIAEVLQESKSNTNT